MKKPNLTIFVRTCSAIAILLAAFPISVLAGMASFGRASGGSGFRKAASGESPACVSGIRLERRLEQVREGIRQRGLDWKAQMTQVAKLDCRSPPEFPNRELDQGKMPARTVRIEVLEELPESFDWRDHRGEDWTTPARNQGPCGACWAFVAIGIVEAQFNIFANNPHLDLDLSEQELVSFHGDSGCGGGSEMEALGYIRENGIVDEACLPYRADDAQYPFCGDADERRQWIQDALRIEGGKPMTPEEIKSALITKGPVGILIGAKVRNDFKFYAGGIYEPTDAEPSLGAHSLLLVGYDDGDGCWVIKNSWGRQWGEDGFARLRYGICDVEQNGYLRGAEVSSFNLKDSDRDGFFDVATGGDDCDDSDPNVHAGREYQVFYKDSLREAQWRRIDGPIRAVGATTGVLDVSAPRMRFYRVMETSPMMREDDRDGIPDSWRPVAGLKPIRHDGEIGLTWSSVPPGEDIPGDGVDHDCDGQDAAITLRKLR